MNGIAEKFFQNVVTPHCSAHHRQFDLLTLGGQLRDAKTIRSRTVDNWTARWNYAKKWQATRDDRSDDCRKYRGGYLLARNKTPRCLRRCDWLNLAVSKRYTTMLPHKIFHIYHRVESNPIRVVIPTYSTYRYVY